MRFGSRLLGGQVLVSLDLLFDVLLNDGLTGDRHAGRTKGVLLDGFFNGFWLCHGSPSYEMGERNEKATQGCGPHMAFCCAGFTADDQSTMSPLFQLSGVIK
jgi:hypothetical protein